MAGVDSYVTPPDRINGPRTPPLAWVSTPEDGSRCSSDDDSHPPSPHSSGKLAFVSDTASCHSGSSSSSGSKSKSTRDEHGAGAPSSGSSSGSSARRTKASTSSSAPSPGTSPLKVPSTTASSPDSLVQKTQSRSTEGSSEDSWTAKRVGPESLFNVESGIVERPCGDLQQALLHDSKFLPRDPVYWESFFVVFPMFCGYAALFGLQHEVKLKLHLSDDATPESWCFTFAVSFVYIFNFLFRMAHKILLARVSPRGRVFFSMVSMILSMLLIAVFIMILGYRHMFLVFLAYALGGAAIGCFESNFLSCLTPLGNATKGVAITAVPVGVAFPLVGGQFLMGPPFHVSAVAVYFAVIGVLFMGILIMSFRIPPCPAPPGGDASAAYGWRKLMADLRQYRLWLPNFWHYPLASTLDMFTLACFAPGVALYVYDKASVEVRPGFILEKDSFLALFNIFNLLGGVIGRYLSYRVRPRHPMVYGIFNIVGAGIIIQWIPALAPAGAFLILLGDGLIYGSISRHIDAQIPKQFNLAAISFWLFVGDFGAILGQNCINPVKALTIGSA